jgi:hypothetical protein
MKKTMILLISVVSIWGCKTDNENICILPPATGSSNSPVVVGGVIELNANDFGEGFTYNWTGPNGYESSSQSPILENTTFGMQGIYTLTANKGICTTEETVIDVSVYENPVSCSPIENTLEFDSSVFALPTISFSSVMTSTFFDNYQIDASSLQGDLTIDFNGLSIPFPGVYDITSETSFSDTEVAVSFIYSGQFMRAGEGLVSVTFVDGNISATFCDVHFYFSPLGEDLVTSANIIDN